MGSKLFLQTWYFHLFYCLISTTERRHFIGTPFFSTNLIFLVLPSNGSLHNKFIKTFEHRLPFMWWDGETLQERRMARKQIDFGRKQAKGKTPGRKSETWIWSSSSTSSHRGPELREAITTPRPCPSHLPDSGNLSPLNPLWHFTFMIPYDWVLLLGWFLISGNWGSKKLHACLCSDS